MERRIQVMYYANVFACDKCGDIVEVPGEGKAYGVYHGGQCNCGGTYKYSGETYDQEFVDEQEYNERQDKEYEDRHKND